MANMAGGHVKLLLLLLGTWTTVRARQISSTPGVPERIENATRTGNAFDIYGICPGNYTTCLSDSCRRYVPLHGRCIACKCPYPMEMKKSAPDRVSPETIVKLGSLSVHIGSMGQKWGFLGNQRMFPNGRLPYLIHNITGNAAIKSDVLEDLSDRLSTYSGSSVALPVLVRRRIGVSQRNMGPEKIESSPGMLHLPFRVKASEARPLPGLFFLRCVATSLHNVTPIKSDDERSYAASQLVNLLLDPEVVSHLGKIVRSVWPHLPTNISFSCVSFLPRPAPHPNDQYHRLVSLLKQFSVSINGTSAFGNIIQSLDRVLRKFGKTPEIVKSASQFKNLIEKLELASNDTDGGMAVENFDLSSFKALIMNSSTVQDMFENDENFLRIKQLLSTLKGALSPSFSTAMPGWSHSPATGMPTYSDMLDRVAKEFSEGKVSKFDKIAKYLEYAAKDLNLTEPELNAVKKFQDFVTKLRGAGKVPGDSERQEKIDVIVDEGFSETVMDFEEILNKLPDDKNFADVEQFLHRLPRSDHNVDGWLPWKGTTGRGYYDSYDGTQMPYSDIDYKTDNYYPNSPSPYGSVNSMRHDGEDDNEYKSRVGPQIPNPVGDRINANTPRDGYAPTPPDGSNIFSKQNDGARTSFLTNAQNRSYFSDVLNSLALAANVTRFPEDQATIMSLRQALEEFKNYDTPTMHESLKTAIEKFKTIANRIPEYLDLYWIDELLNRTESIVQIRRLNNTYNNWQKNHSYSHCIVNKLSRVIHGLSFEKFARAIAKHVCNGTEKMQNSSESMNTTQRRINGTVRLLSAYKRSILKNRTLDGMRKTLDDSFIRNGTQNYEVDVVREMLENLTKISEIPDLKKQRAEISKFWQKKTGINFNLLHGPIISRNSFRNIRDFIQDLLSLAPPMELDRHYYRQRLCGMAAYLSKFVDKNASFAEVTSKLLKLTRPMPEEDSWISAPELNVSKVYAFLRQHNMNASSNLTTLIDLITSSVKEFVLGNKLQYKMLVNISKLAKIFPYSNTTRKMQCMSQLKTATGNRTKDPSIMPVDSLNHDKPRLTGCIREIVTFFASNDSPFEELKSLMRRVSMTSLSQATGLKPGYVTTTGSIYYDEDHTSTQATPDCTRHAEPGLIVPRETQEEVRNGYPVFFRTARGGMSSYVNAAKTTNVFYNWGLIWLTVGPRFNKTEFLFENQPKQSYNFTRKPEINDQTGNQQTPAANHIIKVPFEVQDGVPEVFVQPSRNGEIVLKDALGKIADNFAVRRTLGTWIVKEESSRRERREAKEGDKKADKAQEIQAANYTNCPETLPESFRCLQDLDAVNSNAILRLVSHDNSMAIGVLAFAPSDDNSNLVTAFSDLSKVKNLVSTTLPTGDIDSVKQNIKFAFKPLSTLTIVEGEEKILKIGNWLQITSVDGFGDLAKLRRFALVEPKVAEFLRTLNGKIKWPSVLVTDNNSPLLREVVLKYRENSSAAWRVLKPGRNGKLQVTFAGSGEINLQAKQGSRRNKKEIAFSLNGGSSLVVKIMILQARKEVSMTIPRKFLLPAVPFDAAENIGFMVESVVMELLPEYQHGAFGSLEGLAIVGNPASKLGEWQFRCETCEKWRNVSSEFIKVFNSRSRREANQVIGRNRRAQQTGPICSYEEKQLLRVLLLNPKTSLRFQPRSRGFFWTEPDAWEQGLITLALYRIQPQEQTAGGAAAIPYDNIRKSVVNGSATLTGTYDARCIQEITSDPVVNLTKLISPEKMPFAIERLGCDGTRSSMKLVNDVCGQCGGRNKSCTDCNGDIDGNARRDDCGNCVEGNTGRLPVERDCAKSCENTSYFDECGFCQKSGRVPVDVKDCTGICGGKAKLDKCGACRKRDDSLAALPEKASLMDICGVCGGDNSTCLGCDGMHNSQKIEDKCSNCKLPSDPTFNQGCGKNYFISSMSPSVLVVTRNSKTYSFKIRGYFYTYDTATCSLQSVESPRKTVSLGESQVIKAISKVKEYENAVHELQFKKVVGSDLLPGKANIARWKVTCVTENDLANLSTILLVRSLNPWNLTSIEPSFFPIGNTGGNVVVTGTNFPQGENLVCAATYFSLSSVKTSVFDTSALFRAAKMMVVKATFLSSSQVQCPFPNFTKSARITVHVLTERGANALSATTMHRYVRGGVLFEYREKAPAVKAAMLTPDLEYIGIQFDTDVTFVGWRKGISAEDLCKSVLKMDSTILGNRPVCSLRGSNSLMIRPGKGAQMTYLSRRAESAGKVKIKEGAVIGRSLNGATQTFSQADISIMPPLKKATPIAYLRGLKEVEPCQPVVVGAYIQRGVGPWSFQYIWTVEVEERPQANDPTAIKRFLEKQTERTTGKMIKFDDYEGGLQDGGNYTISLRVRNAVNESSEVSTLRFHIKSHNSAVRVSISGAEKRTVRSSAPFSLLAKAKFLKPKCKDARDLSNEILDATMVEDRKIQYMWKVEEVDGGETSKIPTNSQRKLKISAGILKPGNYKFTVTAFYFEFGEKIGAASTSVLVKVEGGPVFALISGPKTRVVMSDGRLRLDASTSVDPNDASLSYSWTCEEVATLAPCSVLPEEQSNATTSQWLQRADSVFPFYQTDAILNFPAHRLTPGLVARITLTIRAGDRNASDAVLIVVQDAGSNLPTIEILQKRGNLLFESFPIGDRLKIRGAVVGNKIKDWMMTLEWTCVEEEGFAYLDLTTANMTAVQEVKNIVRRRRSYFSLVLKKNALLPGSTYKFQLRAQVDPEEGGEEKEEISVYAEVQVKTTPMPAGGSLIATPTNGTSLDTMFTVRADGWVGDNEDQVLNYRFAYRNSKRKGAQTESLTFMGSYTDQPEISTYLPEGAKSKEYVLPIVVLIRINEDDDTVRKVEANVTVKPADDNSGGIPTIDEAIVENIANEAAEALVSGDRAQAISKILLVGQSIKSNEKKKEMRDLADTAIKKMKTFEPASENDAEVELDSVRNLLATFDGNVSTSEESKGIAIEMIESTLKEIYGKKNSETSSRKRRAIDDEPAKDISEEMAEIILSMYDTIFQASGNSEEFLAESRIRFKEHVEFIMKSLCSSTEYDEPAQIVNTGSTLVGAQKVSMPRNLSYGENSPTFSLSSDVQSQFSEWECDPSTNESCPGACISFGSYRDVAIPFYENMFGYDQEVTRINPISAFFVRNPADGTVSDADLTGIPNALTISYKNLPVENVQESQIECRFLNSLSAWTNEGCSVVSVVAGKDVVCQCNQLSGYFAVFTTSNITSVQTSTPLNFRVFTTSNKTSVQTSTSLNFRVFTTSNITSVQTSTPLNFRGFTTSNITSVQTSTRLITSIDRSSTPPKHTTTSSSQSTKPCQEGWITATTCPHKQLTCADFCSKKSNDPYIEEDEQCQVGITCVCANGMYDNGDGDCVKECSCEDDSGSSPDPSGLGTAAIAGLTIGLVVVCFAFVTVGWMQHKKMKEERQVTPTNSMVNVNPVQPSRYDETPFFTGKENKALVNDEGSSSSGKVGNEYQMDLSNPVIAMDPPPEYSEDPNAVNEV